MTNSDSASNNRDKVDVLLIYDGNSTQTELITRKPFKCSCFQKFFNAHKFKLMTISVGMNVVLMIAVIYLIATNRSDIHVSSNSLSTIPLEVSLVNMVFLTFGIENLINMYLVSIF